MSTSNTDLADLLEEAVSDYPTEEIGEGISTHPVRDIIEEDLPETISNILNDDRLIVKSSAGKGRWTTIPWIAVLDSRETDRIQEGVYVVYLLEPQEGRLRLTLIQGVTEMKNEQGTATARQELETTAEEIRDMVNPSGFLEGPVEFPHASSRNELYGPGTICYKEYSIGTMPTDEKVVNDLQTLVDAYQQYVTTEAEIVSGGYWEMVMTKREKANAFLENPSKEIFQELVDPSVFWGSMAYQKWHRELFEQHTPDEVAEAFREARENGNVELLWDYHQLGEGKATEILRALDPDRYAILNARSREGMEALGYDLPDRNPSTADYQKFTDNVREAHNEYDLRQLMGKIKDEPIPPAATALEIADWAFSSHYEGDLDLSEYTSDDQEKNGDSDAKTYQDFTEELEVNFETLTLENRGLYFPDWERIRTRIERALRDGNNVLLFGPPGTGKTKLARQVCQAAVGSNGFKLVTGSADWSTFDTIGGYQTARGGALRFEPGVILERFQRDDEGRPSNEWLVIDELNRADIDKAFGALFSALSGESVTLSYEHDNGQNIEILHADQTDHEYAPHQYFIPEDWRMIATINTLDKTSLYEMSYAFMRRWAFIPIGIPDLPNPESEGGREDLANIIEEYVAIWTDGSEPELARSHLTRIGEIWYTVNEYRTIGPAIVEDIYEYIVGTPAESEPDYVSPVVMYVYPQLEGLRRGELKGVINSLAKIINNPQDLWRTAEDFFQADLSEGSES